MIALCSCRRVWRFPRFRALAIDHLHHLGASNKSLLNRLTPTEAVQPTDVIDVVTQKICNGETTPIRRWKQQVPRATRLVLSVAAAIRQPLRPRLFMSVEKSSQFFTSDGSFLARVIVS
jgi:hypothetical protein